MSEHDSTHGVTYGSSLRFFRAYFSTQANPSRYFDAQIDETPRLSAGCSYLAVLHSFSEYFWFSCRFGGCERVIH